MPCCYMINCCTSCTHGKPALQHVHSSCGQLSKAC
jgi:hypothetical protein